MPPLMATHNANEKTGRLSVYVTPKFMADAGIPQSGTRHDLVRDIAAQQCDRGTRKSREKVQSRMQYKTQRTA